jgi:beta-lactamase class A
MNWPTILSLFLGLTLYIYGDSSAAPSMKRDFHQYSLEYNTLVDPGLQHGLEQIDAEIRARLAVTADQTALGVVDLISLRVAMIRPDFEMYGASIPKIGILLAYFQLHPEAATNLNAQTRHELGLMIKASDNEMAAKFSRELGLKPIQAVLNSYQFYDVAHGGGIWVGKHYGKGGERYGDPVADHSHAATVRQLLRYFLMLEQGKLVSPVASQTMRDIFASPDIPHDNNKFLRGLAGRGLEVIRKSGSWEDWLHDSAVVTGPGRQYILVALTKNPRGDEYLVAVAQRVDDLLQTGN